MPTIQDASIKITNFPNKFASPFGNDDIVPLYSSVPLKSPVEGCLDCVVCGSSPTRYQIISNESGIRSGGGGAALITPISRVAYYIDYSQGFTASNVIGDGFFPSSGGWSARAFFDASDNLITVEGTANLLVTGYSGLNSPGYAYQFGEISINGTLEYNPSTSLYYWATMVSAIMDVGIVPGPYYPGIRSSQFSASCSQDDFTFTSIEIIPWSSSDDFNRTSSGDPRASGFQWGLIWGALVVVRHDN